MGSRQSPLTASKMEWSRAEQSSRKVSGRGGRHREEIGGRGQTLQCRGARGGGRQQGDQGVGSMPWWGRWQGGGRGWHRQGASEEVSSNTGSLL